MALVLYEVDGGVATLTMNRPERRNALSSALVEGLLERFTSLRDADDVACVVLTGAGEKAFCAGGDLADGLAGGDRGPLGQREGRARFASLVQSMHACGKPVVGAVAGDALGGGFGLAMACDLVVVAEDARLGTPEIKLGLFPHIILAELMRDLPRKFLAELIYTGRKVRADELLALGVVNRVVPRSEVVGVAQELAASVAAFSPAILRLGKDGWTAAADQALPDALRTLHGQLEANLVAQDAMEGIAAFMQKRPPVWKGR